MTSASLHALCAYQEVVISKVKNHVLTSDYHWKRVTKAQVDDALLRLPAMIEYDASVPSQQVVVHTSPSQACDANCG